MSRILVVGGDRPGVQAALDLAEAGMDVVLVESSRALAAGSNGNSLKFTPKLLSALNHPRIQVLTGANLTELSGELLNFTASIDRRPVLVNPDICTGCGRCEQACPVDIKPPDGRQHKAIHSLNSSYRPVPSAFVIDKEGKAPCSAACPAGVNAHGFVALISRGKFTEALDLITEAVPFPSVLGRVCSHPCQKQCTRGKIDHSVSICALKRFAADHSSTESSLKRTHNNGKKSSDGPPKVAIIGAGPAGLTAARDLARLGHQSIVYEALPVPGGMITVGMPRFRLPREVRQKDIDEIVRLGIEIKTSTPVGPDLPLESLQQQYLAVLIATGAHRNQRIGIAGENLDGVINSIALLQALNLKQPITIGKRVVVIGGGYTAIDSARTAIRLHCDRVQILYRRSLEEMPANAEEVAEAQEEGVEIEYLVAPVRIIGKEGQLVGVECIRMGLGERDSSGRRRPLPIEGSEFFIEADSLIVAVGQRPDLSFLDGDTRLTEGRRHILINRYSMATAIPGIFAAGDVAGETATLIDAIAAGRRAALSIDKFLRGKPLDGEAPFKPAPVAVDLTQISVPDIPHVKMPCLPLKDRVCNFEEVDLGFKVRAAMKEASRCLHCGGCSDCRTCEMACELNAINHNAREEHIDLEVDAIVAAAGSQIPNGTADRRGLYRISSPDDLAEASAIAGRVMVALSKHRAAPEKGPEALLKSSGITDASVASPANIGVFICRCGGNISDVINIPELSRYFADAPGVACVADTGYACAEEFKSKINTAIKKHQITHAVVAACSCCGLDHICLSCTDRRVACKSNLLHDRPDLIYEFVNVREHCARVHQDQPEEATLKARKMISAAVSRCLSSRKLGKIAFPVEKSVLIWGSGESAVQAASCLAGLDIPAIIISPNGRGVPEKLPGPVTVLNETSIAAIDGPVGDFRVHIADNGKTAVYRAGAIIIDREASGNGLPPLLAKAWQNPAQPHDETASMVPGIFVCQTNGDAEASRRLGAAAATKAAILVNKGVRYAEQTTSVVDATRCRGCGTCVSVCPSGAISLAENDRGVLSARVNEKICRGCGTCVAHCPSGAVSQKGYPDSQITASIKVLLDGD